MIKRLALALLLIGTVANAQSIGPSPSSGGGGATTCAGLSDAGPFCSGTAATSLTGTLAAERLPAFSGDITTSAGSAATTLATVNSNVGSFGSATASPTYTVNGKGLITAAANVTITPAVGSITGLGTGVATALGVNVGSAGSPVLFNGAGGTPSSLVGTNITGTASGLTAGNVTGLTTNGTAAVGQLPGTTTSDNAATGKVGEYLTSSASTNTSSTITLTIASPMVVTWNSHGLTATLNNCTPVTITTNGTLPTGLPSIPTVTTPVVYVIGSSITTNTFQAASTIANCIAATAINTTGSQSGTHTGTTGTRLQNNTAADIGGLSLTAGDWEVWAQVATSPGVTTTSTYTQGWVSLSSVSVPTPYLSGTYVYSVTTTAGNGFGTTTGPLRVSIASTTTVFASCYVSFAISTNSCVGKMEARRIR